MGGCQTFGLATPTPLPGWSADTRELFVDEAAFPDGWYAYLYQEANVHPEANQVSRRFSDGVSSGGVSQGIWRSYTVENAEKHYRELESLILKSSLTPEEAIAPWLPPTEIEFQEYLIADEYSLVCGWDEWAYCRFLARYRNYVTFLTLDREAMMDDRRSEGLTYQEITVIIEAVDMKFEQVLHSYTP
jgi:hypothetical protein